MKKILLLAFFAVMCCTTWGVNVTFRVNLSQLGGVSVDGVHLAGSFQMWDPGSTPLTNDGSGVYSTTLDLAPGTYQYKFINGNAWSGEESVPAACGVDNGLGAFNRSVVVVGPDALILPAVCFGSCDPCPVQPAPVQVTFSVDMSTQTVSPDGVHFAADFQSWNPSATAMTNIGNGIWQYTAEILPATTVQYKFINGNGWAGSEIVPSACGVSDGFGGYNRTITTDTAPLSIGTVCFGSCEACPGIVEPVTHNVTIRVDMSNEIVDPNGVHLVGSFQNYTLPGLTMSPAGNGIYEQVLTISENSSFTYKFLNGDTYAGEESVPQECGSPNGFGGYNRDGSVGTNDTTFATVCFGSCSACPAVVIPDSIDVTLEVNLQLQQISADGVHVAGNFNGWSPSATLMSDPDLDSIFTAVITIPAFSQLQFKFINGNSWSNAETVPSQCGISSDNNRVIYTDSTNVSYGPVCFGQCTDCNTVVVTPSNQITFQVNMGNTPISPDGVHIAGNFNNWNPASDALIDQGNGIWSITITADEWANLSFKFINGNTFDGQETVPSSCGLPDGFGGYNRLLETGSIDVSFGPVCFSSCDFCPAATQVEVTFLVNMANETVSADGVHIAGNFQDWNPATTAMVDSNSDGIYEYTTSVDAGSDIAWKYINGNTWSGSETVPAACGIADGFGGYNRGAGLSTSNVTFGPVCFGACTNCAPSASDSVQVVFYVNMNNETISPDGVHIAGNFQDWNPATTAMTDSNTDGIYEYTTNVPAIGNLFFRFINGNTWTGSEVVPVVCGEPDGFGGYNRLWQINGTNETFGPVCFGACTDCDTVVVTPTDSVMVHFLVNMANETVSADGVHLAGNFQGWNPSATAMTDGNNDGVYEASLSLPANSTYEFKFINGNAWGSDESVPADCGTGNPANRSISVDSTEFTFGPVCFGACTDCDTVVVTPTDSVMVHFLVNMANETVSADGVHLAGNFQGWNPSATAMTDGNNDGVYEASLLLPANSTYEFKFINGNAWGGDETVPAECGTGNPANRSISVDSTEFTFGPICFGECTDCGSVIVTPTVSVTFLVNMTNETVSANGVHLAGLIQGWNPGTSEMTDANGDGIYEITLTADTGSTVPFKFINGNAWANAETVPSACGVSDGFGGYNRSIEIGSTDLTFGPVCFGACENCAIETPVAINFQVDMANEIVNGTVGVVGSFNNWDITNQVVLAQGPGTLYQGIVIAAPGDVITYKFVNGDTWSGAETVPADCGVDDGTGNFNRSYTATADGLQNVNPVCFSACGTCVIVPTADVTFRVNLGSATPSPNGVHIAGTFNGFSPNATAMTNTSANIYSVTLSIPANTIIQYKYLNGDAWGTDETVPFECGVDNGFGGFNRSLNVGSSDVVLPVVCLNSCVDCEISVTEVEDRTIRLYPNPTQGIMYIETQPGRVQRIRVYDATGSLVMNQMMNGAPRASLDLGSLSSGLYWLVSEKGETLGTISLNK